MNFINTKLVEECDKLGYLHRDAAEMKNTNDQELNL